MEEQTPILVLVTLQRSCARLIRAGADMGLKQGRPIHVLHVVGKNTPHTPERYAQTLDYLYALAGEAGAQMCLITADVPVTAIANYARDNGVKRVVMGGGAQAAGIAETLSDLMPGVEVRIMDPEEESL